MLLSDWLSQCTQSVTMSFVIKFSLTLIGNRYCYQVDFGKNSTKTIRLFALNFYEVTVVSAFGLINYDLREISSS